MPGTESRVLQEIKTFADFLVVGIRCTDNAGHEVIVKPGEIQIKENACNPVSPISLAFTAPVTRKQVRDHSVSEPASGGKNGSAWGEVDDETNEVNYPAPEGSYYNIYLPSGLKAAQEYKITVEGHAQNAWGKFKSMFAVMLGRTYTPGNAISDKFGRALAQSAAITFITDHRLPNIVVDYSAAVIERNIDSEVPVYVNNLDKVTWSFNRVTATGTATDQHFSVDVPKARDIQFAIPMGLRQMLGGQSGAIFGEYGTVPEIQTKDGRTYKRPLFAEVTPYQVHLKLGHFNSMVWVTDLATGQPVADADVSIYKDALTKLGSPRTNDGAARTDADGVAFLPGTDTFDPDLTFSRAWETPAQRLMVRVIKDREMALLPVWSQFEIDSYRSSGTSFYPTNKKKFGHMVTWGTTAQGIYHPGDTIQYKLTVRNQDNKELVAPPSSGYWLEIVDPTGKVIQKVENIALNQFGSTSGEFNVGKKASVGWYDFRLKANFSGKPKKPSCTNEGEDAEDSESTECTEGAEFSWTPMRVLVSDFTPVPFNVRNSLNGDLFHPGDKVDVTTNATLHSGGPYTQAQARVTATLSPVAFVPKNPAVQGFTFGNEPEPADSKELFQSSTALNDKGEAQASFNVDEPKIFFGRILVESAVQDDRGKSVAHQASADYAGVTRFVGMRLNKWFFTAKEDIAPAYIVTDERGTPVKEVPVTIILERKQTTGAKVKSAGRSYMPDTQTEFVKESECTGTSDATAKNCSLKPERAGEYRLHARVTDTRGREQTTEIRIYVSGPEYVMWDEGSDSYIDIVADKDSYHIGDTAHYLVKNPYPGAKALVTVERFGVIERFVTTFTDSTPVIDLPIKPEYLPGFYLSVVVMSPRVDKPMQDGQIDLGKPAFRMGYVKVPVKDEYKEITVTAQPEKELYRPGDKVRVKLHAAARHPKNEPIELAVAVLDEAVFDLIAQGSDYYNPYKGFYNLENLDLRNYSLLTRLIGRQKFEKKGANPGGDGGAALSMRTVFKYISYWNPGLKTDANGDTEIEFTVPDNLTGWRILAIAQTPTDRFGLGEGNFKVNRPTEVRPEMPNQVTEGDSFEARFSVMNRTDQQRTIKIEIKAEGDVDPSLPGNIEKTVALKPYERTLVALPVKAKTVKEMRDIEQGSIRFTATAGDATDRDGLTHTLPVNRMRSLEVGANYGTTTADTVSEPVEFPANIFPDVGGLSVSIAPTVIGNLEGAFKYMRDYPYPCWEQVLTRGVMAAQFKNLRGYISTSMQWPGHEALPDSVLAAAANYQAPNGGMAYFIATDEHVDPYLSAYTALAFNWLRASGYAVPENTEKKLHAYLLNLLRHDEAPSFYSAGMTSSVRAVALAALAESKQVDKSDLDRYTPFVKDMSLFGKVHYAKAAMLIAGGQTQALETTRAIMSHANETGGKFVFTEELDDSYSRILSSTMRENCAILDLFTALGETSFGKTAAGDVPYKLVRYVTQTRGGRDHWENTQENMFCMNALVNFSRAYEKDTPAMKVTASLDKVQFGTTEFKAFRDPLVTFNHPTEATDIGKKKTVDISREGTGRLYYATRLAYAPRESKEGDTNAGIDSTSRVQHEARRQMAIARQTFCDQARRSGSC